MPRISFTANLQRHVSFPSVEVEGLTVSDVLSRVFDEQPALRGYVLDEQGAVRHHVVIFLDGRPIADRRKLTDPVSPDSEVYVFQALSGG